MQISEGLSDVDDGASESSDLEPIDREWIERAARAMHDELLVRKQEPAPGGKAHVDGGTCGLEAVEAPKGGCGSVAEGAACATELRREVGLLLPAGGDDAEAVCAPEESHQSTALDCPANGILLEVEGAEFLEGEHSPMAPRLRLCRRPIAHDRVVPKGSDIHGGPGSTAARKERGGWVRAATCPSRTGLPTSSFL